MLLVFFPDAPFPRVTSCPVRQLLEARLQYKSRWSHSKLKHSKSQPKWNLSSNECTHDNIISTTFLCTCTTLPTRSAPSYNLHARLQMTTATVTGRRQEPRCQSSQSSTKTSKHATDHEGKRRPPAVACDNRSRLLILLLVSSRIIFTLTFRWESDKSWRQSCRPTIICPGNKMSPCKWTATTKFISDRTGR